MNGFYPTRQTFVQTGHAVHRFVRVCEKVNTLEGVGFGHIWEGQAARLIKKHCIFSFKSLSSKNISLCNLD